MKTKLWILGGLILGLCVIVYAQQPVINNALTDVWDSTNHWLKVNIQNATLAVTQSGTWTVQPGNTANTTAWKVDGSAVTQPVSGTFWQATQPVSNAGTFAVQSQPTPVTSGGLSTCVVQSAASTNATNCKNAAGQIYHIEVINTTSTIYYLRLYNLSAAPTCSSATGFVRTIPAPNGAGAGAGFEADYSMGEAYVTGISFCFTGGGSSTDNTNAATGVYITVFYK